MFAAGCRPRPSIVTRNSDFRSLLHLALPHTTNLYLLTGHRVAEPGGGLGVHLHVLHVEHLAGAAAVQERYQQRLVLQFIKIGIIINVTLVHVDIARHI